MVKRRYWVKRIEDGWKRRSVLWLSGVRRVGKTCLTRGLRGVEYFDCELPRVRRLMDDPESFLADLAGKRVVLDEIHRLGNPAELLKIAADHYPDTRVLATGSSTLGASAKFRDTLVGRKAELWLTPMNEADTEDFGDRGLGYRFLRGGLPPFFLEEEFEERDFQEWMDGYWAKDIQELFRIERRHSFQRFAELLMERSGGIFSATTFARPCEVSRTTIANYLGVLEATFVVHVVRPFSTHKPTEIVAAPKVYGFDTGFVCYHRGWSVLRNEDFGLLWKHYVLNEIHSRLQTRQVRYWRDKRGHEVDFVLAPRGADPTAIECKWTAADFDAKGLRAFRHRYPRGSNLVVCRDVTRGHARRFGGTEVRFVNPAGLIDALRVSFNAPPRGEPHVRTPRRHSGLP